MLGGIGGRLAFLWSTIERREALQKDHSCVEASVNFLRGW